MSITQTNYRPAHDKNTEHKNTEYFTGVRKTIYNSIKFLQKHELKEVSKFDLHTIPPTDSFTI